MNNAKVESFFDKITRRREEKKKKMEAEAKVKKEEKPKEETKIEVMKVEPQKIEVKPKGLSQKVDDITEKLSVLTQETKVKDKLKKKKFKMPLKVKSQLNKLAMKNKVLVILIQINTNIKTTIGELKDGMLILDSYTIHDCPVDCVGLWNGKFPTVILPEWDLKPLSLSKLHQEAVDGNRLSYPQKIILRAMEYRESLGIGKKIGGKGALLIGVGVIALFYMLFAQG